MDHFTQLIANNSVGPNRVDEIACPVCLRPASSNLEAAECCLWKHPQLDLSGRFRIAKAVDNGSTWLEAIQKSLVTCQAQIG